MVANDPEQLTMNHGCWTRNEELLTKKKTPNKKGEPPEEPFKNSYKDPKGCYNKDE
tara:strand:- start:826 stop:993 length:168 start_codon:yes stop_codon:yes gene_type:complete